MPADFGPGAEAIGQVSALACCHLSHRSQTLHIVHSEYCVTRTTGTCSLPGSEQGSLTLVESPKMPCQPYLLYLLSLLCAGFRSVSSFHVTSCRRPRRRDHLFLSRRRTSSSEENESPSPVGMPVSPSRRDILSSAVVSVVSLAAAVQISPDLALADDAYSSVPITASWSAIDGLNTNADEFIAFDVSAYKAMEKDPTRTPFFRKAIEQRLAKAPPESLVVLDLGTGPVALFAIIAAELGAKQVFAMEANPAVAASARAAIRKAGWTDTITVLEGFSSQLELPTKADFCIAEIIGSVATEEGAYATIRDAHARFLKEPNDADNWIPNRIQTYAAPASYTLHNLFGPPEFDWNKLNGEPVRFNCRDPGLQLLADPVLVEDVSFNNILSKEQDGLMSMKQDISFTVDAKRMEQNQPLLYEEFRRGNSSPADSERLASETAHSLSGIALWPRLILGNDILIDSRAYGSGAPQRSHWQTVLPIMSARPVGGLMGGEKVVVSVSFDIPRTVTKAPRYAIDGRVDFGRQIS